ncbi:MAG: coenzyme F420-0:L-glutamate ligase [Chloroflexi bacterium]|nr:coenzyme F420-0:L-glutamate ligase [Chloroflexota bacterium]
MPTEAGGGRVEIVAVPGVPEVVSGDDLPAIVAQALAAALSPGGSLASGGPLRPDDVVVVTSKIVSKAEGALVDLATIEPRPEAIAFAERWDRDARQIEVVLREARRVVRMANGVLITETRHGFICANGGVDASNVGRRSGEVVLLLPTDPDASATRLRDAIRRELGMDVAVIVSDSFGRPWRWGITDVAIGVSGIAPLEDLRGTPDADGRLMRSTIRAVADEIASAAELALGKASGRPLAVVRGARPTRSEATIGDALMPEAFDLFH